MKNKEKLNLSVTLLFIFLLFFSSYLYRRSIKNDIKEHSKFTVGKIRKITTSLKSGDAWGYEFKYNNRFYEGSKSTHVDYDVKIGDYFIVNFSDKSPNNSNILYHYKLNDNNKMYLDSVWDTIPTTLVHSGLKQ